MNLKLLSLRIIHYLYGVIAQGVNGGVATVASIAGLDTVSLFVTDVPKITPHLALGIFLGSFGWNCFFYFKAHPLPDKLPDDLTSFQAAVQSVVPPSPPKADLVGAPPPVR